MKCREMEEKFMVSLEWNLKPVQYAVLDIFKAYAAVCKKHGLRYYAAYGTALGAIRHKGFIPWDDDFDVAMPRPDYARFAEIAIEELPAHLDFRRGGIGVAAPFHFAKVVDVRKDVRERLCEESHLDIVEQPYIDVFVLDGLPDNLGKMAEWRRMRHYVRMCQLYRYPNSAGEARSCMGEVKIAIGRLAGMLLNYKFRRTVDNADMMRVMDEVCCKWPYEDAKCVAEFMFFRNKASRIIPKSLIGEGRMVPFCDTEICVPSGVETILAQYYGDYMTYPPEKDRKPPHIMKLLYEGHV